MTLILLMVLGAADQAGQAVRTGAVSGRIHEGGRGGTVVVLEDAPAGTTPRRYTAVMNGRGEYRIFGIAPGRYRVFATSLRGDDEVLRWGVIDPVAHALIEINGGEDLTGADFVVPKEFFTVSGRLGASPDTSPSTSLTLVNVTQPDTRLWIRLVPAGTEFDIAGVLPGSYELRASRLGGEALPFTVPFSVAATNVTGLRVGPDAVPATGTRSGTAAAVPPLVSGPTGSVSGRVLDADTGQPLAGVVVAAQPGNTTKTAADGSYTLSGIPAGASSIRVDDGLLWPGLTLPRDATIVTDRETSGIDFRVRLSGSIGGRVVDEKGEPLTGVRVLAIRREYGNAAVSGEQFAQGTLLYFMQGAAVTDDRGRYELERLFAGRQYWLLAYRPRTAASADARATDGGARTVAATYYPSSESLDAGLSISLRSQERRDFVDIQMRSLPSYCADAVLTGVGQPGPFAFRIEEEDVARLRIIAGSPTTPAWRQSGTSGADGRVRVCDLHRGRFRLTAEVGGPLRRTAAGTTTFDVGDRDVQVGSVEVAPPLKISGQVLWDVPPPASAVTPQFRLSGASFPAVTIVVNPSVPGEFVFDAYPGHYAVVVAGPREPSFTIASPFYIKDITHGNASIMETGLTIAGPGQKLVVTLGSDAGSIAARVVDAGARPVAGAGVLIVSDAPQAGAGIAISRAGHTNADGTFVADGLAPGRYDVIGVEALPPFLIFRPALAMHIERSPEALEAIARARSRGERVAVRAGASVSVSLQAIALSGRYKKNGPAQAGPNLNTN